MADAGFLRLYAFLDWIKQILGLRGRKNKESAPSTPTTPEKEAPKTARKLELRQGKPCTFADRVFANEMDRLIALTAEHYERTLYKEALKTGFFEYQVFHIFVNKFNKKFIF